MLTLVVDVEVDVEGNNPSPYVANNANSLSAIGFMRIGYDEKPKIIRIKDFMIIDEHKSTEELFRECLATCDYIVCHNSKFDVGWLRAVGYEVSSKITCTMINEYLLQKAVRKPLSLSALSEKYDVTRKDEAFMKNAIKNKIKFSDLPWDEGDEYLSTDVIATKEIYLKQLEEFRKPSNISMEPIKDLMSQFCNVLVDIEANGMKIDMDVLNKVDSDYATEQNELNIYLSSTVKKLVGDTPINLSSPEQLSQVIYSYNLVDKKTWKDVMNIGVDPRGKPKRRPKMLASAFAKCVDACFEKTYKTQAIKCPDCNGFGTYRRYKKNGGEYKNESKCEVCRGKGYLYENRAELAGLQIQPDISLASAGGFKTDKKTLTDLESRQTNPHIKKFLSSLTRLSAIDTYRSSFIEGIKKGCIVNGDTCTDQYTLHANFNQCITATGRLSSSNPNLQNMPKGKLFPVRRAFVSRFDKGKLLEVDYSQLEFRVAGILSRDEKIREEVSEGFDVHAYTAKVLTDNGEPTERGPAKASTFRPLYGGSQGTFAQREYFREFFGKYTGVFGWHIHLQNEAIENEVIKTATGRQFAFPNVYRTKMGVASVKTQIVNYPVQSVATADIVPLGVILLHKELKKRGLKSLVINTVHDSVVVDVHPNEIEEIKILAPTCLRLAQNEAEKRFGLDKFIPLDVEMSMGNNWMEQMEVT
tara:strand:- start:1789 stop:3882 length:2094 start_codon:yes stop_codon:yes gene_type:complete